MDRFDFYFKQPVSEAEFDGAFDAVEAAIWNTAKDRGIYGIATGFVPGAGGAWNISVTAGKAIDKNGARLYSSSTITQSVLTATDGSSCIPSAGNRRWVSLYARFGRDLSDPRTDGLGAPIKFNHAEALIPATDDVDVGKLLIVKGTEDLVGNPLPARPALHASAILIADVLITDGDASLALAAIDSSRAERLFDAKNWSLPASGEFNGANPKFLLVAQYPLDNGMKVRFYVGTSFSITTNAVWNPVTETWATDIGVAASKIAFTVTGFNIYKRTDYTTTWSEVVGPTGWDSYIKLVAPTSTNYLDISADTDIVTKGSQTVYWAFQAESTNHLHGQSVSFPKKFAATPSSVTFSAPGNFADSALTGTGWTFTVTAPYVTASGAYIVASWSGGTLTGDLGRAERNVLATY